MEEGRRAADRGEKPGGDWENFGGYCTYVQASTWSIKGKQIRTSRWIGNRGTSEDKETIVRNYTTKSSAKKSVGTLISLSLAESIFTGSLGGNFSYEWGWEKSASFETRSEKSIPPCSQIAMTWTPYQRVVRVNPVFNVTDYAWNKSTDRKVLADPKTWSHSTTWRNRGASWRKIYSYGYYIDGISDEVIPGGRPDGREDKWQQALDRRTCAR